jgi:Flp pilus assembly protein TadG
MTAASKPRSVRLYGDDGAAAVEFALVSFLLFALLLGTVGFGYVLFAQQSALHAAREGARLAAVGVNNCTSFQKEVARRGEGADVAFATVTMSYSTLTPKPGDAVTVTVPYSVDLGFLGFLGFSSFDGSQRGISRAETVGSVTACP